MRGALLLVVTGACSFATEVPSTLGPEVDAAPMTVDAAIADAPAKPPDLHLRIEAMIDGESYLHIQGKQLWFENRIFAAPGRWDANAAAPWDVRPIKLNGVDWLPTWPDVPNPENRDCMCLSSKTTLPIGVPAVPTTTTWTEVQTRRAQGIIQYPSAANDWELIVLISDYMVGGAAEYIVDVDVKVP